MSPIAHNRVLLAAVLSVLGAAVHAEDGQGRRPVLPPVGLQLRDVRPNQLYPGNNSLRLDWVDTNNAELGYEVQVAGVGGGWAVHSVLPANSSGATLGGLTLPAASGESIRVRVRATSLAWPASQLGAAGIDPGEGVSAPATFAFGTRYQPIAVAVVALGAGGVSLRWRDTNVYESGYELQYSQDAGATWIVGSQVAPAATLLQTAVVPGIAPAAAAQGQVRLRVRPRASGEAPAALGQPGTADQVSAATALPADILQPVGALTLTGAGVGSLALAWTDTNCFEMGHEAQISHDGIAWTVAGTAAASSDLLQSLNIRGLAGQPGATTLRVRVRPKPFGEPVHANGSAGSAQDACAPLLLPDADADGTVDAGDGCPNDPQKVAPGVCGCGVADTDTDGDGTADCNDQCPNDAAKTAPGVCGCGTTDVDSDNDGTLDCNDGCPSDALKTQPGTCGCGVADTDTDGDGTADCNDQCPNDAAKTAPGVCGCGVADLDSDNDETLDCNDGCPNDALKTQPGTCGCGVADTDTDGDGTADCNDQCPNDAAKTAPGVCGCGTADVDSDNDGTLDCNDGCPNDALKTQPGTCGCGVADTDTDRDGTADCTDQCPNDATKTAPGVCGCGVADLDSDNDGTLDCNDGCPNDALKTQPGTCGCGVADTDTDGDGTADCNDQCPNDAAKTAPGVCGCGTTDLDSDNDGTLDCNDGCPNDAGKTASGVCGCGTADIDSDNDGTLDCNDGCPNDALKTQPDTCGCGVADTDTDGDGTADCNDQCPNDAAKTAPGVCGCGVADVDSDNDGTLDCNDGCPNDALKTQPGTCGCGVADTDADGDGAADCNDQCPNDAAKTAPGVCGCGVADVDSDNDGALDCNDDCPNDALKTQPGTCGCGVADTDTDGDGTADCNDQCPNDAAKTAPGVCGCGTTDVDSDNDGTLDCNDGCPSDALKTQPGTCGCGVADTDTDRDGTADCTDQCPNDAAKTAPGVCGCGVADLDSDNDGTLDCNDGCPNDALKTQPGTCGCGVADTDTDGDGTADCNDQCPNDPAKTAPGVCGCGTADVDSDNDGTLDCNDGCPSDALKTQPGTCGCGVADTDADGDGTADCNDQCPNDAAKTAPGVCGCGVADVDSDNDGTLDCNDGCPNDALKTQPGTCGCGVADTDTDGDGTADCNDQCPNDAAKTAPGACGCGTADVDSDNDGTLDCNDGCPNDALKTQPGTCGCGVADTDTDGDGTADCNDQCPNDPAKTAPGVCGCGTADVDSDNDGTLNCNDGCPNDPQKVAPGVCGCGVADTDTDGDGTADCNDQCPNDAAKTAPGVCGCGTTDVDSDNDGTLDCNDGCPSDALKTQPGTCGCGVADTDTDGDGTADCNDQCPNDAAKTAPGVCGCGVADADSDNDGTLDCNDGCPNDALKTQPGTCGCGVADTDADGDGAADCNDQCPNDAAKTAPGVCGCGVADFDSDNDGTFDCNDGCPNDASKIAPGAFGCGNPELVQASNLRVLAYSAAGVRVAWDDTNGSNEAGYEVQSLVGQLGSGAWQVATTVPASASQPGEALVALDASLWRQATAAGGFYVRVRPTLPNEPSSMAGSGLAACAPLFVDLSSTVALNPVVNVSVVGFDANGIRLRWTDANLLEQGHEVHYSLATTTAAWHVGATIEQQVALEPEGDLDLPLDVLAQVRSHGLRVRVRAKPQGEPVQVPGVLAGGVPDGSVVVVVDRTEHAGPALDVAFTDVNELTGEGQGIVGISWTDANAFEAGYVPEVSFSGGAWVAHAATDPEATSAILSGLTLPDFAQGQSLRVRVRTLRAGDAVPAPAAPVSLDAALDKDMLEPVADLALVCFGGTDEDRTIEIRWRDTNAFESAYQGQVGEVSADGLTTTWTTLAQSAPNASSLVLGPVTVPASPQKLLVRVVTIGSTGATLASGAIEISTSTIVPAQQLAIYGVGPELAMVHYIDGNAFAAGYEFQTSSDGGQTWTVRAAEQVPHAQPSQFPGRARRHVVGCVVPQNLDDSLRVRVRTVPLGGVYGNAGTGAPTMPGEAYSNIASFEKIQVASENGPVWRLPQFQPVDLVVTRFSGSASWLQFTDTNLDEGGYQGLYTLGQVDATGQELYYSAGSVARDAAAVDGDPLRRELQLPVGVNGLQAQTGFLPANQRRSTVRYVESSTTALPGPSTTASTVPQDGLNIILLPTFGGLVALQDVPGTPRELRFVPGSVGLTSLRLTWNNVDYNPSNRGQLARIEMLRHDHDWAQPIDLDAYVASALPTQWSTAATMNALGYAINNPPSSGSYGEPYGAPVFVEGLLPGTVYSFRVVYEREGPWEVTGAANFDCPSTGGLPACSRGSGYVVGDEVVWAGPSGSTPARLRVVAVGAGGSVQTLQKVAGGKFSFKIGEWAAVWTGGSGTGLAFTPQYAQAPSSFHYEGDASNVVTLQTATPVAAPVNVRAVAASHDRVTIAWDPVHYAADGIQVQYRRVGATAWTILPGISSYLPASSGSFEVSGLLEGASHEFQVRAASTEPDVDIVSAWSATLTQATTLRPPTGAAHTSIGQYGVQFSWIDQSTSESAFRVEQLQGSSWVQLAQPATTSSAGTGGVQTLLLDNLWPGTCQNLRVSAYRLDGTTPVVSTPLQHLAYTAPLALVQDLRMESRTASSAALAWTPATAGAGQGYPRYKLERRQGPAGAWVDASSVLAHGTTSFTVVGLPAGSEQWFRLRSCWSNLPNDASVEVVGDSGNETEVDLLDPVGQPGLPTVVPQSDRMSISWFTTANATQYLLQKRPLGATVWTNVLGADAALLPVGTTSYELSGLAPGQSWQFRVQAHNAGVQPPAFSAFGGVQTSRTAPLAPGAFALQVGTQNYTSYTLQWADAAATETGYIIAKYVGTNYPPAAADLAAEANWNSHATTGANATSLAVAGLLPQTGQAWRLRARDTTLEDAGQGPAVFSSPVYLVAGTANLPAVDAASIVPEERNGTNLLLRWTGAATAAGQGYLRYEAQARRLVLSGTTWIESGPWIDGYVRPLPEGDWNQAFGDHPQAAAGTLALAANARYRFRVRVHWALQPYANDPDLQPDVAGAWSNTADIDLCDCPELSAPSQPVLGAQTDTSFTVTVSGLPAGATDYQIGYRPLGGTFSTWGVFPRTSLVQTITGLSQSTTYEVRVRAVNDLVQPPYASLFTQAPYPQIRTAPAAVSNLRVTARSVGAVGLAWTDNATAETSYRVARLVGGVYQQLGADLPPGTVVATANDAGMTLGTTQTFRVRAHDANGGGFGVDAFVTTTIAGPPAPASLAFTVATGLLTWTNTWPVDALDRGGIRVYSSASSSGPWTLAASLAPTATSWQPTGLVPCVPVYYQVRAYWTPANASVLESAASNTATATLPGSAPAAPSGVGWTYTNTTTLVGVLSWSDLASNEQSYAIERLSGSQWGTILGGLPAGTTSASLDLGALGVGFPHNLRVLAIGVCGAGSSAPLLVNLPPPAAPTGVTLVQTTSDSIKIAWNGNTDGATGYRIGVRSIGTPLDPAWSVERNPLGDGISTPAYQREFTLGGLLPSRSYELKVYAVKAQVSPAVLSTPSPLAARTLPGAPVQVYTAFYPQAAPATSSVDLSWTGAVGATAMRAQVSPPDGEFVDAPAYYLDNLPTSPTTYVIGGLASNSRYKVRVQAKEVLSPANAALLAGAPTVLYSEWSNQFTWSFQPPPAVTQLRYNWSPGAGQIRLDWTSVPNSVTVETRLAGGAWSGAVDIQGSAQSPVSNYIYTLPWDCQVREFRVRSYFPTAAGLPWNPPLAQRHYSADAIVATTALPQASSSLQATWTLQGRANFFWEDMPNDNGFQTYIQINDINGDADYVRNWLNSGVVFVPGNGFESVVDTAALPPGSPALSSGRSVEFGVRGISPCAPGTGGEAGAALAYRDAGGSYVNAVYAQPESVVATGRLDAIDVAWSWRKGSITEFVVERRVVGAPASMVWMATIPWEAGRTSYSWTNERAFTWTPPAGPAVTPLQPCTNYEYLVFARVRSTTAEAWSPGSLSSTAAMIQSTDAGGLPVAPTGLARYAMAGGYARLWWNDLPNETSYQLEHRVVRTTDPAPAWTTTNLPANTTSWQVWGLVQEAGSYLDVRLRAATACGPGAWAVSPTSSAARWYTGNNYLVLSTPSVGTPFANSCTVARVGADTAAAQPLQVAWQWHDPLVADFRVFRKSPGASEFVHMATVPGTQFSWTDPVAAAQPGDAPLVNGQSYAYKVLATYIAPAAPGSPAGQTGPEAYSVFTNIATGTP